MAIVADIYADIRELSFEDRIAEITGFEIELLPKAWRAMGNVMFSIFPEILAVGINNGGGIVVDTFDVFFVNRNNQRHAVLLRDFAHELNGRPVRDFLDHTVPAG